MLSYGIPCNDNYWPSGRQYANVTLAKAYGSLYELKNPFKYVYLHSSNYISSKLSFIYPFALLTVYFNILIPIGPIYWDTLSG